MKPGNYFLPGSKLENSFAVDVEAGRRLQDFGYRIFPLAAAITLLQSSCARAHGLWTYEPRQGRKAATVVCSASAVVTLASLIADFKMQIAD